MADDFKNLLKELSFLFGFSWEYDENKTLCENVYSFFDALLEFLGGSDG